MKSKRAVNLIVNLGSSDKEIKIKDLAGKIKKILKSKKLKLVKTTPGSVRRRAPNIKILLKFCKGFKFRSLDYGLNKTIDWYKDFMKKLVF